MQEDFFEGYIYMILGRLFKHKHITINSEILDLQILFKQSNYEEINKQKNCMAGYNKKC